jgi:conjugal transfer pilus assembly protein TraK
MILSAGAALFCVSAAAQQTASASFGVQKEKAASGAASVDFSGVGRPASGCGQMVQMPLDCNKKASSHVVHHAKAAPSASAKKVDPLAVHPDAAVKDVPQKEIILPGVLKIAGVNADALDFSRSRTVDVSNNGSQTVYLSDTDQNRIQAPWIYPKIVGTAELVIDEDRQSNNVYIQFKKGVTRSVQIYIEDKEGGRTVLGLNLVPKHIPGQTILIRDTTKLAGESIKAPKGDDYVSQTQALMETLALGSAPAGFSEIEMKLPPVVMSGLVVTPKREFSSVDREVVVYDVTNPANTTVRLEETEFDGDSVLAVSIFPTPVLRANEHAQVIVIARKQKG